MRRFIFSLLLFTSLAHAQQSVPTSTPTSTPTSNPTSEPSPSELCGNGKLEALEECDDGNIIDGDGCSHSCLAPGGRHSFKNTYPFAGPKIMMLGGAVGLLRYSLLTLVLPREPSKAELIGGLSLSAVALFAGAKIGITRATKEPESVCRNYKIELGEQCDDGNARSGDGCSNDCIIEK